MTSSFLVDNNVYCPLEKYLKRADLRCVNGYESNPKPTAMLMLKILEYRMLLFYFSFEIITAAWFWFQTVLKLNYVYVSISTFNAS